MTDTTSPSEHRDLADAVVARVLARAGTVLDEGGTRSSESDGDQYDREDRAALRRVAGLSTELEDVTEVEYRQLRLERVVLAGLWSHGDGTEAEVSLRELAALALGTLAARCARPGEAKKRAETIFFFFWTDTSEKGCIGSALGGQT